MKALYTLTLLASLPIALVLTFVCIPLVLVGNMANLVLSGFADWLNGLSDNLQEINDGNE